MLVFLCDIESDYELSDEELNLEEALAEFYQLSDNKGSFFGIKTEKELIQFAWQEDDKWLVDIPYDMGNFICLQKYANYEDCAEIIESLYNGILPEKIKGLFRVNIMTDDLDQIIDISAKRKTRFLLE